MLKMSKLEVNGIIPEEISYFEIVANTFTTSRLQEIVFQSTSRGAGEYKKEETDYIIQRIEAIFNYDFKKENQQENREEIIATIEKLKHTLESTYDSINLKQYDQETQKRVSYAYESFQKLFKELTNRINPSLENNTLPPL